MMMNKKILIIGGVVVLISLIGGILLWKSKFVPNVVVFTDKTEYEQGEKIKVTIENNLNQNIWYYGTEEYAALYSCLEDYHYALKVQKLAKSKGIWNDVKAHYNCCFMKCYVKAPELKELKPKEKIFGEWNQKVSNSKAGIDVKLAEHGKYRFVFIYYLSNNNYPNYVYSNEFTIKEKGEASAEYKIYLSSRQFIPEPGISDTLRSMLVNTSSKRIHVLLQFYHIPNNDERYELSNLNVTLCSYVHNNAYFASIPTKYLTDIYNLSFVRWIGEILPEDKISRYIRNGTIGDWAINPNGTVNLIVEFFKDVSLDDAERIIERYDGVTNSRVRSINALVVTIPQDAIHELANEDSVQWIEEVTPPPIAEPYDITDITEVEK